MNRDFIGIQALAGELKLSHKRREIGMTVTTAEFVLQKPHMNYIVQLADIISIVPFDSAGLMKLAIVNKNGSGDQVTSVSAGAAHYRIRVKKASLHNRSGIYTLGLMEFVIPVHAELLAAIGRYSGLVSI